MNIKTQNQTGDVLIIYGKKITITDSQIINLPSTPAELIAAPGANKLLIFQSAVIRKLPFAVNYAGYVDLSYIQIAYTDINNITVDVGFFRDDSVPINTMDNILMGIDDISYRDLSPSSPLVQGVSYNGGSVNQPLVLAAYNVGAGNFTGGDPSNTLEITIFYSVIDV